MLPTLTNNFTTTEYFVGGGETGNLLRQYSWESHPLGHPQTWPASLLININVVINSAFPMFIWWSDELYAFYNDAYIPALGKKHPQSLGSPAKQIWPEIWNQVGALANIILSEKKPIYTERLELILERKGYPEETYWTFSYSPAFNDDKEVAGVFCACFEVTDTVLAERRFQTLQNISAKLPDNLSLPQTCQYICENLYKNKNDLPFSAIYLLNGVGKEVTLAGRWGMKTVNIPQKLDLTDLNEEFPLAEGQNLRQSRLIKVNINGTKQQVAILPIYRPGQDVEVGFLVAGLSARLDYDTNYERFHELLAGQIGLAIAGIQSRNELIQQSEYLQDIFQQAPAAITILKGPEYIVDMANPGICALWGRQQKDVLGKPLLEALPEIQNQGIKDLLDGVLNTGVPYVNTELPVKLEHDGKLKKMYFSLVYHPLRDSNGFITGVIAVAIGVNEQVEARKSLEKMNQDLLLANTELDNFVYVASHDLKAPISNIESLMQALEEELPADMLDSTIITKILSLMQDSIQRFKKTVADLAEIVKVQKTLEEATELVEIPKVVENVLLDFAIEIEKSKAQIETDFTPDSVIAFSPKNSRSIIYNLLNNALKYRDPNRPLHIKITTQRRPGYLLLSVTDTGLGMDLTDEGMIFKMFKRLHDHVEGSGIGLYIVNKIIENAGGKIKVESKPGAGTTFKVYFKS